MQNHAVRGITSYLYVTSNKYSYKNSGRTNAISKTNLMNNFAKLLLDITEEGSLNSVDHFDACNKQSHRGLCYRNIIDSPLGVVRKYLCMDPL